MNTKRLNILISETPGSTPIHKSVEIVAVRRIRGITLFSYINETGWWNVSELTSGCRVGEIEFTSRDAWGKARKLIEGHSVESVKNGIDTMTKQYGIANNPTSKTIRAKKDNVASVEPEI